MQEKSTEKIGYGTILHLGNHVIACGDARDPELVGRLLDGKTIKLIACDPPFGINIVQSKKGFAKLSTARDIQNDDIVSEPEYAAFTKAWLDAAVPHLAKKNSVYIFNSDKMIFALREGMQAAGVRFSQLLIWAKSQPVIGRKDFLPQHELIAFGWHGTHEFLKSKDKSLLFFPKPAKSPLHPTMKPIALMRHLILDSTRVGDVIFDPFLGSGSTLIACEQTMRACVGIEIDPEYCKVIKERYEKSLGKTKENRHGK